MQEIRVYIANLGKYNEGKLVGGWFTAPIDFEEVKERIGLNEQYEECAIHDYEAPFEIGEYTSIEDVNRMNELYQELAGSSYEDDVETIMRDSGYSLEELVEKKDDIIFYSGADSMSDVAYECVNEGGMLDGVPENLSRYFDYEAFGRDLELEGTYVIASNGIYELPM